MIQEIKTDLKIRAAALRSKKVEVRKAQRAGKESGQSDLAAMQWDYRHRHVAYSLLRGRAREKIEQSPRRPLNEKLLKSYMDGYRLHVAIKKGQLKKGPPDPKKLYVVVGRYASSAVRFYPGHPCGCGVHEATNGLDEWDFGGPEGSTDGAGIACEPRLDQVS